MSSKFEIVRGFNHNEFRPRTRSSEFPFEEMEVGDAFFIEEGMVNRKNFGVMLYHKGKKLDMKFSAKKGFKTAGSEESQMGLWVQRIK